MNNYINVIEIQNKLVKLLIGYILDGQVKIIYANELELSVPFNSNEILDVGSLSKDISRICHIDNKELNFKYDVNEAVLVIPSFGLEIFESTKTTNTVAQDYKISKLDVLNVFSLVERERIENPNNTIINIIPNYFMTSESEISNRSPINIQSDLLTLNANVYVLSKKLKEDVHKAFKNAGVKIKNVFVSALCGVEVLNKRNYKYKNYIYIDYGEKYTFLHLVNNGKVVNSTFFNNGSDNLVKKVQEEYKISDAEALKLIRIFGFDSSLNAYNPPIVTKNENGYLQTYSKSNLNVTISDYYKELGEYLSSSIKVLLKGHESMINQLPLVFVGKGFKINGLKEYIIRLFNNNIDFIKSNIVGADFNLYINLIGAIYLNDLSNEIFKENVVNVVKENHNLKEGE